MIPSRPPIRLALVPRRRCRPFFALATGLALTVVATASAQDPAAERLYREAQRQAAQQPEAAVESLELLVQQFSKDPLAPRALLELATLHRRQRDAPKTNQALERLIGDYGRSEEAASGYVMRGEILTEIARNPDDLEQAAGTFRRVPLLYGRESYRSLPARAMARLRAADIAYQLGDPATAASDYLSVLEDETQGAATAPARLGLARTLIDQGRWRAGIDLLQRVARAGDPATTPRAQQLANLVHRRLIRPELGGRPWTDSGTFAASSLSLKTPSGVAADRRGHVIVTDSGLPTVAELDPQGQVIMKSPIRGLSRPTWSPTGQASAHNQDAIVRPFGGRNRTLEDTDRDGSLKGLRASATDALGTTYVLAKSAKGILRYRGGRYLSAAMVDAKRDWVDVARGDRGRIYALDAKSNEVRRLGLDGRDQGVIARGDWKRAEALAVDDLGYIFVLDRGLRQVNMYDPFGNRMTQIGPEISPGVTLRTPVDIAVDGNGRLFVVDAKLATVVRLQ